MTPTVTPMIHVPDIEATVAWYQSIGFSLIDLGRDGDEVVFAMVGWGDGRVMFNVDGRPSDAPRREVDLYVHADDIDALFERVKTLAEVVEPPHETFYGHREFIVRDLNRFWITFGQPTR